jgi:RNA ligase
MNFFTYINETPASFWEKYIEPGYVAVGQHAEFPLSIFSYSRRTVQENKWDDVTSKCRGIIINRDTGEIISRPFEKFHNHTGMEDPADVLAYAPPVIWEKLDGFMATLYTWQGVDYVASKGSFHSIHAKWATAWLRKKWGNKVPFKPEGWTLVFEGLHRDLRIVVDYKERQELVLLAVINNETGEEYKPEELKAIARAMCFETPVKNNLTLEQARRCTMGTAQDGSEEGFVLTWYQDGKPPFRLKMKFIEYLRLHRMVTGVSPKRIWEVLATNQSTELDEYLRQSTPWFSAFVQKWMKALTIEYDRIHGEAHTRYQVARTMLKPQIAECLAQEHLDFSELRKAYALRFTTPENKPYAGVMFAMLDGKDIKPVIWKMVKHLTSGKNPMVDAHNT